MDNKGQISLEAALILGVGILIIISVFNIWFSRMSLAREAGEAGEAKMVGIMLGESINLVYANGENFSITLTEDEINYSRLKDIRSIEGGGMKLPIVVDLPKRRINITKDMSKTGGGTWNTTVTIVPSKVARKDPTARYPETTIRNNGTHVLIHSNSANIEVVQ
jgi:hypothetical protein